MQYYLDIISLKLLPTRTSGSRGNPILYSFLYPSFTPKSNRILTPLHQHPRVELAIQDMSTPAPSITNPLAGKRGACDRCRGQKLKCRRPDQNSDSLQATCVRCFKAGASCSYGTAKRAGRSPASEPGKSRLPSSASRSTTTTNPRGSSSSFLDSEAGTWQDRQYRNNGRALTECTAEQESEREPRDTVSIHTQSPLSLQNSSKVSSEVHLDFSACSAPATALNLPWSDDMITPFSYQDTGEVSGLEIWALQNYGAQSMNDVQRSNTGLNSNSHGEQHRHAGVDTYGVYTQARSRDTQIAGMSDRAMDIDLLTTDSCTTSFSPTNAVDTRPHRDRDRGGEWTPFPGNRAPSNPTSSKNLAKVEGKIKLGKNSLSGEEIQHRRMQELSKLAMELYSQLANHDPKDHQPPSANDTKIAFPDKLIGNVLKCSNTFLTLLTSFSTPSATGRPSRHFPPSTPTTSPSISYDKPTYNSSSSSSSDDFTPSSSSTRDTEDHVMDEPIQHAHSIKRPVDSFDDDVEPPSPPLDTATVLQLLTCYIRIVHLYHIMYTHILDYMSTFLPSHTPHLDSIIPPIFPNIQVGGFSLDRFGAFQILLLLQISVHVLGEIESVLGLPKEHRVGKSKAGKMGVLGTSVSGEFLKCLLSEGTWRGKKVEESVREQLRDLRRVLKSALDSQS